MRNLRRISLITGLIAFGLAGAAAARSEMLRELENSFIQLHEELRPCVVNIDTQGSLGQLPGPQGVPEGLEDLFRFFGPLDERMNPRQRVPRTRGTGSGFIYDKDGHIVTNNHVVEGADKITVRLWDGKEYDAEVVGLDPDTDLAVIKIDAEGDLPVARLGSSSDLRVGQFAIAVGSPRGFEGSFSFGHISALGRENLAGLAAQGLRFQNLIQTDAAINLGNSGGPLVNIDGDVIGINIAIVWGANNLGFAIPIDTAKSIVPQLISGGKVTRGYLGVQIMDAREFADSLGLPDAQGAFVKQVQPGTPAERAGLQTYDVILKVNSEAIEDANDLVKTISALAPGESVSLEVWRDEKIVRVDVDLDEWSPQEATPARGRETLGIRVRPLTPELAKRLGLGDDQSGVLVAEVVPGSAAEEAGLMEGDLIIEVAREAISDTRDFHKKLEEAAIPGKSVMIRYIRAGREPDITVIKVPKTSK
ncbi:MAG TPA: trypsin-like peptidase domain-containing protein [Candidatus Hydrogenedentes bacterium]|nr:trypsin-like peptidase domain-containing protein [Candidatus Hydrogenedentota bacterium]HNT87622.1 trypsin-like peptidase domain-containing protein [Candidatus Hydrogenedentota bacterium]